MYDDILSILKVGCFVINPDLPLISYSHSLMIPLIPPHQVN